MKGEPEEQVRSALVSALEADLVGPFDPNSGQEVLPLAPTRWYLTGFLAPRDGASLDVDDQEAQDELAAGTDAQNDDAGAPEPEPKRRQFFPSSIGLSVFLPAPDTSLPEVIEVEVAYADYAPIEWPTEVDKPPLKAWQRRAVEPVRVTVPLDAAQLADKSSTGGVAVPGSSGLRLRGELPGNHLDGLPEGARLLSLFLVNERAAQAVDRDISFAFQVRMTLCHERGFLPRPNWRGIRSDDADQCLLALQFREHAEWAVGHNTSVMPPVADDDNAVRRLTTTQLPRHEVKTVKHEKMPGVELGMLNLYELENGDALSEALSALPEIYAKWIERQRKVDLDSDVLRATRDDAMEQAEIAKARIVEGIALLAADAELRTAFQWANRAMHVAAMQMDKQRDDRRYETEVPRWRPFQLAFILLNIASIADPEHADRRTADLIYFPTGGGKTEAYLGLIAFTLLLRRMRGRERPDQGRGVSVILRYTLRLLTLDQLGRAATLICAMEIIRRKKADLFSPAPFTVGLWVGRSTTDNRLKQVQEKLNDAPGQRRSPFPLSNCPWCGKELAIRNIKLVDDEGKPSKTKFTRVVVYCDDAENDCRFTEARMRGWGLPVLFVDEQIYQELPDFLIATVDKFAMMPWYAETGMLFGRVSHVDERRAYGVMNQPAKGATALPEGLLPPELVVQDEMHLISGPLGTMVGLYEVAIDYLSERRIDGVSRAPKIVCSTATVRRAREQIKALFDREMAIFPPRGIEDGDNFFSTVDKDKPGRMYLGVAAPGRALRAVSVRTYATLSAAAAKHYDPKGAPEQPADPYMTLIGYFNALRELGGMRRLVEDEVKNRVRRFADGKKPLDHQAAHPWAANRSLKMPEELTSRAKTEAVKSTKDRLAVRHVVRKDSIDTVLASNMISVGLDVDRLGLMVVTGQPKTASEYIQATSRVGRTYPGLVVVCLNVARPRDRSHFERFVAFHESFYREVEATSVTPFSNQTLDRGMAGTLLSMLRHDIGELQPPGGFMKLADNRDAAEQILDAFIERGKRHRQTHDREAETRLINELRVRGRRFLDAWETIVRRATEGAGARIYSPLDRTPATGSSVMHAPTDDRPDDHQERLFVAPMSMRDVESETHVWMRYAPLDEGR